MPRQQPQIFNSDDGPEYTPDTRHRNARPPPRAMSKSPVMGYVEQPPHLGPLPYRHPLAMRSAPGLDMPHCVSPPPGAAHPQRGVAPMMHRQQYPGSPPGPRYPARSSGYPQYTHMGHQHPPMRAPAPPHTPHTGPMAHQMFHNAARLARNLPHRSETPITDSGAPSSDPPSSGTAPSGSSPPTPKDQTSIQVIVDPAFIDPALIDLQESSSDPVLPHQYFQYADGLAQKETDEAELDANHASVPATGFVQRVKAMLESKAAAEVGGQDTGREPSPRLQPMYEEDDYTVLEMREEEEEMHELAANETPHGTMIAERESPAELPASPIRLPELGGSPVQPKRRITKEIVRAGLAPSSVDNSVDHTGSVPETSGSPNDEIAIPSRRPSTSESGDEDPGKGNDDQNVDEPKMPKSEQPQQVSAATKQADAVSGPSTDEGLGLSVVDYAVEFAEPQESTEITEDSQSKDPFMLDADTITLQHQKSKEDIEPVVQAAEKKECVLKVTRDEAVGSPVSLLLPGEDSGRCSAVSQLPMQTLGIDGTLHLPTPPAPERASSPLAEESTQTAQTEPKSSPTPKTPKTYSKSVQLRPSAMITETDTSSSNRYSLPPDLSILGDTTTASVSDMVTDVAVRFSLPQTTCTVIKPHIVDIQSNGSPDKDTPKPGKTLAMQPLGSKSKRNSVTFADEVAPLMIKKAEQHPKERNNDEPQVTKSKSNGHSHRPLPLPEKTEGVGATRDSTTDLRFAGINAAHNRFGSTHLPGLKEESIEEMSISNKHALDKTGDSDFPLPARIAAVKAMQQRRLQESAEKARARRAARHPNRPLAETRDLPSLNFSRMNLIDKLNEALEVRSSKSMEVIRRRDFSAIYCPSPQRPQSTEPLRERYMSFFNKPEDFASFLATQDEPGEEESCPQPVSSANPVDENAIPTVEVQPNTEVECSGAGPRPLSPEDFLNVATQVNRLSIPSVRGLSERLSEILPGIHDLQLDQVLSGFSKVSDEIGRLGDVIRPGTVLSTRTSAGFRTLAERAEEFVNGKHESGVHANRNKDLPGVPETMSADKVPAESNQAYLSGSVSAPTNLGLTRPHSALTHHRSPTNADEVTALLPPEMNPIARNAKRAMISSGSSRPWNQDENYPWAGTKVDIDLTVPSEARTRESATTNLGHLRNAKSLDLAGSAETADVTRGIDIGSIMEHGSSKFVTNEQCAGVSRGPVHKQSKRSVMGSITRRMGLVRAADCQKARSISSPLNNSSSEVRKSQPHRPGERYPTSSLTPPAAFNVDEVRSFFSDDSSDKERNASFRKRLTNFKAKGKSVRLNNSAGASNTPDPNASGPRAQSALEAPHTASTTYDAGSINGHDNRNLGASSSANTYDGVGMGKAEFRMKRFGEKLRHLVLKGGELIRSWSQRAKPTAKDRNRDERVRDDWLSDSVYSGV